MPRRQWWQLPSLRTDETSGQHRKISWLELFFDLFFVVTVSQISHALAGNMNLEGLRNFFLLFIPLWWVWIGATYYFERFETEGVEIRLFTFLLMLPAAGLAIFANDGLGRTYSGFTLSYAAARILITLMWLRSGIHVKEFRRVAFTYVTGFTISIILTIYSNFIPLGISYYVFGAALLIDLITPFFTIKTQRGLPQYSTSRLPERFGLFVLIVLGESIVSVVSGISTLTFVYSHMYVTGALGIANVFCLWWIYFDFIARRSFKPGIWWSVSWGYLHLPLLMCYTAMGASLLYIIWHGYTVLYNPGRLLYAFALAMSLIITGAIEFTLRRADDEPAHKLFSPGLKIVSGFIGLLLSMFAARFDNILLMICLLCLLLIQVGYGLYVWFTQE